jgi:xanthine dehydrogenase accessory factor
MGCGGVVHLLLERDVTAGPLLKKLDVAFTERRPMAVASVIDGPMIGQRAYFPETGVAADGEVADRLREMAFECFERQRSFDRDNLWVEWCAARPGLFVFGAGDDTVPLVKMARQLGWYVEVADGRSNLATQVRFAEANSVRVIDGQWSASELPLRERDAAVLMTHSLEQDRVILASIFNSLPAQPLRYLGVLGPKHRAEDLLRGVAVALAIPADTVEQAIAGWMELIHAPIGLDLGGETPADIALSVMAEVQRSLYEASGLSLHTIRGVASTMTNAAG